MVVRNLLGRLGLNRDSDQLRIIATSASLSEGDVGLTYLEQFFGVDRDAFQIITGAPTVPAGRLPVSRDDLRTAPDAATSSSSGDLASLVALACRSEDGRFRRRSFRRSPSACSARQTRGSRASGASSAGWPSRAAPRV